jgi:hypothetical protein
MRSWDRFRTNGGIFPDQLRYYQGLKNGLDLWNQKATTKVCASQCKWNITVQDHDEEV